MSSAGGGYNRERFRGSRRYKRRVIIATEGTVSEPRYFDLLQGETTTVQIACVKKNHQSSPAQVLACMKQHLSRKPLDRDDEAWLVVDKDQWSDEQLHELYRWTTQKESYHFALSNPKFEYWLLLHFDDGHNIAHAAAVDARLRQYLPNYDKHIDSRHFTSDRISVAVERAKSKDRPSTSDWPRALGTTVYRIIEAIRRE